MENVYPEQTHDQVTVEQIATPEATVLLQTRADTPTGQAKQLDDNPATSAGLGVSEITLRAVCMVFSVAVLVASAVTLSAIDEVEDYFNDYNTEYGHVADHRRAAKWSLFVAVMGIIFHSVMGLIRCLYLKSCVKSIFSTYAYLNAALCIIFGLSLFAGGVANAIYAANNAETIADISDICDQSTDITNDFCNAFKRVRDSEAAAASISFFTMIIYAVLVIIMISSGVIKQNETQEQDNDSSSPAANDTAVTLSSSSSYMSLYAPMYRPTDAPPPYTP